jgi:hypothetical protein
MGNVFWTKIEVWCMSTNPDSNTLWFDKYLAT